MNLRIQSKVLLFLILGVMLAGFQSCENENSPKNIRKRTIKANEFVYDYMNSAYLWTDKIPSGINPQTAADPFSMLDNMVYNELDKWTYLTDDAGGAMNEFQGITTTFGYNIKLGRFSNSDELFGIIVYVVKDSPAEKAGLKRGMIIMSLNGGAITESNYMELIYGKQIKIETGKDYGDSIGPSGIHYTMTSKEMYEDPVNTAKVINANGFKVGYLAYTGYLAESHNRLDEVFSTFKSSGVTEVVLDLRYNPGGNALTPPYLASFLAPLANVAAGDLFLREQWNYEYMSYYQQQGEDLNSYFNKNTTANLNLQRVFVLTTEGTASASEATISGLMPYMQVIKIGTTTHGKYCGAALIQPVDENGKLDAEIGNWLISMIVYKYINSDGYTDFVKGIKPDYAVEEDLFDTYPFGDVRDRHLAKALSIITGQTYAGTNMPDCGLREGVDYRLLPELTEKLNKNYGNTRVLVP